MGNSVERQTLPGIITQSEVSPVVITKQPTESGEVEVRCSVEGYNGALHVGLEREYARRRQTEGSEDVDAYAEVLEPNIEVRRPNLSSVVVSPDSTYETQTIPKRSRPFEPDETPTVSTEHSNDTMIYEEPTRRSRQYATPTEFCSAQSSLKADRDDESEYRSNPHLSPSIRRQYRRRNDDQKRLTFEGSGDDEGNVHASARQQRKDRIICKPQHKRSDSGQERCYHRRSESTKRPNLFSNSSTSSSDDEYIQSTQPRHILKPPKYDGTTSFETFWAQFQNCSVYNKWTKHEELVYLRSSLQKEAGQVLWDYGTEVTNSLKRLMKTLKERFGGTNQADKFRIEVRNRRRTNGETLQSLHSDIRRLVALAFPELDHHARETMACDYFIDALADPNFALKVRERSPVNLDSALRIALQLEVWTKDVDRTRND